MKLTNMIFYSCSLACLISTWGCSSNSSRENAKPEVEVQKTELPTVLSKNTDVKDYFETLEKVIDEYAKMMEEIVKTGKEAEKREGEPSITDAMTMVSNVSSSTLKMAPLLEKMDRMEKESEILKKEMTPEEIEAFSKTYAKIMTRFMEIGNKTNQIK